jgi:hypothetical protein
MRNSSDRQRFGSLNTPTTTERIDVMLMIVQQSELIQ